MPRDPRDYQIVVLASLLAWGVCALDFDVRPLHAVATVAAALFAQAACGRLAGLERFDPKSALISSLSLCLLLRVPHPAWAAAAAAIAIASKFVLRVRGRHVLNPTCGAIVALLACGAPVWVSAGQWGQAALGAFAVASLGTVVVTRARRADVTLAFLGTHAAVLFGRAAWLGQPVAIPLHQLTNGALLLFAFFMITDPRTTPDSRAGRLVFAVAVAAAAGFVQFGLFRPNGLLWALAAGALLVPVLDRVLPGPRHAWPGAAGNARTVPPHPSHGGMHHAPAQPAGA
jgi:Na+-transporting NADH:ubiquinone oxidoreductase subunit NqrB